MKVVTPALASALYNGAEARQNAHPESALNEPPCPKRSDQRDKSERENFTIRMAPNLKKALKIQAIEENRDASDLIEDAVRFYLCQPAT